MRCRLGLRLVLELPGVAACAGFSRSASGSPPAVLEFGHVASRLAGRGLSSRAPAPAVSCAETALRGLVPVLAGVKAVAMVAPGSCHGGRLKLSIELLRRMTSSSPAARRTALRRRARLRRTRFPRRTRLPRTRLPGLGPAGGPRRLVDLLQLRGSRVRTRSTGASPLTAARASPTSSSARAPLVLRAAFFAELRRAAGSTW